jgi:hypothetical protein
MFVCMCVRACVCISGRQQTATCDQQIPRSFLLWLLSTYKSMLPNAAAIDYLLTNLCVRRMSSDGIVCPSRVPSDNKPSR